MITALINVPIMIYLSKGLLAYYSYYYFWTIYNSIIVQDCFGCQFTDRSFGTKQAGFFWKLFITCLFLVNNLLSLCKIHETVLKVCPFLKVKKLHFVCYYF